MTDQEIVDVWWDAYCKDELPSIPYECEGIVMKFARLVAAREREVCAEFVKDWHWMSDDPRTELADAIRKRGES